MKILDKIFKGLKRTSQTIVEKEAVQAMEEQMLHSQSVSIVRNLPFGVVALRVAGAPIDTYSFAYKHLIPPETETLGEITNMPALKTISVSDWAEPLKQRYGDNKFAGYFFPHLRQATVASGVAVTNPLSAEDALQQALQESQWYSSGYLAIAVQGNQYRPKDVLVMDLSNRRWLSINQSKGKALSRYYDELLKETIIHGSPIDDVGLFVGLGYIFEDNPVTMLLTDNNLVRRAVDINTAPGQDLLAIASAEEDLPYFLAYSPHEHKVRYAMDKDAPLLDSMDEVDVYRDGLEAGLEVEVQNYHPILRFKQEFVPNILLEVNGKRVPAGGEIVGENIPSTASDLTFAIDVLQFAELLPKEHRMVIKRPLATDNYQAGQIQQYVVDWG